MNVPRSPTASAQEGRVPTQQVGPWLMEPCNHLPRAHRWLWTVLAPVVVLLWSLHRNYVTKDAWTLPDVRFYLDMARGHYGQVPQPFTSRPLAPWLAAVVARAGNASVEAGFSAVALVSFCCAVAVVYWLLLRSAAPRWLLLVVACIPFWPQLLSYAGLPDPLYTALLAFLLLALEYNSPYLAASLMLPLMLARESTSLTLVCLLLAGWRRLRWSGGALAIACAGLGLLVVRHVSAMGLANPEQLSGGLYMLGKVVSNTMRTLGLVPWSNVYPVLCPTPAWQMPLALGKVRSVGVCSWDALGAFQASWALLTTFGVLPILLLFLLRRSFRKQLGADDLTGRFCALYGSISMLLAPTLGTWYARLFAYAWPLLLVAVPRMYGTVTEAAPDAARAGVGWLWCISLLVVHLALCAAGTQVETGRLLLLVIGLHLLGIALFTVQPGRAAAVRIPA